MAVAAPLIRMHKPLALGFVAILVLAGLAVLPSGQAAPAITGVTPSSGSTNGGTRITISGSGFEDGALVEIGTAADLASNPASSAFRAKDVTVTASSILATVPTHATAEAVGIRITNRDGQSTTFNGLFTYATPASAPTVTSVTPSSTPATGGTTVVLTGTNFDANAPRPLVEFGAGNPAVILTMTSTAITVVAPAEAPSTVNVIVTSPNGQSGSCAGCFSFTAANAPSVSGISASTGPAAGGTALTVTGSNFAAGARVVFDDDSTATNGIGAGAAAASVAFTSSGQLSVITPALAPDTYTVRVINPEGGNAATSTNPVLFTFLAPTTTLAVSSLSPASGPVFGGTVVTLVGTGFHTGTNQEPTVVVGTTTACPTTGGTTIPAHDLQVQGATSMLVRMPAGAGATTVAISVTNPDGSTVCKPGAFTFVQPLEITEISPKSGPSTGGIGTSADASDDPVAITGKGFVDPARVFFGNVEARVLSTSDTSITAIPPPQPVPSGGATFIVVLNPDGHAASFWKYTYTTGNDVRIDSVTNSGATTNGGGTITIAGANFAFGQDPDGAGPMQPPIPTVTVGGTAVVVKKSVVDAAYPVDPANPCGGTAGNVGRCRYPAGLQSSFDVFGPVRTTSASGVDTQVTNPDGQNDLSNDGDERITISQPLDPVTVGPIIGLNHGSRNGGTAILVSGIAGDVGTELPAPLDPTETAPTPSNFFVAGPAKPTVKVGGITVPENQVFPLAPGQSAMGLTCPADDGFNPGNCLVIVTPPYTAGTAGAAVADQAIQVTNPDGKTGTGSGSDGFDYDTTPAPTFSSFTGGTGTANGGNVVTVNGNLFGPVTRDSSNRECDDALFNGNQVVTPRPTVFFGTTPGTNVCVADFDNDGDVEITVRAPAHAAGSVPVTIRNPDTRQVQASDQYTYTSAASPTGLSFEFASSSILGGRTMKLFGSGFPAVPTVDADGNSCTMSATAGFDRSQVVTPLPSVFFGSVAATDVCVVSSSEVRATVPAQGAGSVTVLITNPDGQGTGNAPFRYFPLTPVASAFTPATSPLNGGGAGSLTGANLATGGQLAILVKTGGAGLGGKPAVVSSSSSGSAAFVIPSATGAGVADIKAVDADGQTGTLDDALTYQAAQPPQVKSVSPAVGSLNGGTTITIEGVGFASGATVRFDHSVADTGLGAGVDQPIRETSVSSDGKRLTFVAPNFMKTSGQAVGPIDLLVCNPVAGAASDTCTATAPHALFLPDAFGYSPVAGPTVTSVTPSSGADTGGTAVTITGTNFLSGATVKFDTTDATDVVLVSSTSITAKAPAHAAGAVAVTVSSGGQQASLANGFTYTDSSSASSSSSSSGSSTTSQSGTTTAPPTTSGTTSSGPLTPPTAAAIEAANKRIEVTVTRDGENNRVSWTLPSDRPALPVLGVQLWASNSPYSLVDTFPAGSSTFTSGTFTHTPDDTPPAQADTKYLVTMFYGTTEALGFFTASTAPDTVDYPGTSSADSGDGDRGLPTWAIVLIILGILFLVVLVAILIARGRNRGDEGQATAAQGYAWEDSDESKQAKPGEPPASEVHQARCPACATSFTATGTRPIVTVCPGCGKKGILR